MESRPTITPPDTSRKTHADKLSEIQNHLLSITGDPSSLAKWVALMLPEISPKTIDNSTFSLRRYFPMLCPRYFHCGSRC